MDLAVALRQIWRYKLWLVPIAVVAVIAGLASTYQVSWFPPKVESKSLEYGVAETELLVDSDTSSLAQLETPVEAIAERAALYAQLLKTQPVRKLMGEKMGIPWQYIQVEGQTGNQGVAVGQPSAEERNKEILEEGAPLALNFTVNPGHPIVNLFSEAPTAEQALELVTAGTAALTEYAGTLQEQREVPRFMRVRFQPLGEPEGGNAVAAANETVFTVVALAVFIGGCLMILFLPPLVRSIRQAGGSGDEWDAEWAAEPELELVPLDRHEANGAPVAARNGADAEFGTKPGSLRG